MASSTDITESLQSTTVYYEEHKRGDPASVIKVEARYIRGPLTPDQVLLKLIRSPINPSDINQLEGVYAYNPKPPSVPGHETLSEVVEVGSAVSFLSKGDWVVPGHGQKIGADHNEGMPEGSWTTYRVVKASCLVKVPDHVKEAALSGSIDAENAMNQLSMIRVNPPTAYWMLRDFVDLKPGDWVIQNAGNSGVGLAVIQIAHQMGVKTLSVIRKHREGLIPQMKKAGADVVVTDEEPLFSRISELTGGASVKLALNAVGGQSAYDLAKSLSPHGYHVTYGAMSRERLTIANSLLIFKDIRFCGFGFGTKAAERTQEERDEMTQFLFNMIKEEKLYAFVEKCYELKEAQKAVAHAFGTKRTGKILFL